jgi:hypothetical protein
VITHAILRLNSATPRFVRWGVELEEDKAKFDLYIPKTRVPWPPPTLISVTVAAFTGNPSEVQLNPPDQAHLEEPIVVLLQPYYECSRTKRFTPIGDPEHRQVGDPYIPYRLIPPDADRLLLHVDWLLETRGHPYLVENPIWFEPSNSAEESACEPNFKIYPIPWTEEEAASWKMANHDEGIGNG